MTCFRGVCPTLLLLSMLMSAAAAAENMPPIAVAMPQGLLVFAGGSVASAAPEGSGWRVKAAELSIGLRQQFIRSDRAEVFVVIVFQSSCPSSVYVHFVTNCRVG